MELSAETNCYNHETILLDLVHLIVILAVVSRIVLDIKKQILGENHE